jgi:plasmid replication initiation protein
VLSSCIPEINEKTNLDIEYDAVREFSKVIELIFTVKEKYPKTQKEIQTNKKLWNENTKASPPEKAI